MASRWRKRLQKMARKFDTNFTTYKRYEIAYYLHDGCAKRVVFKETNKLETLFELMIAVRWKLHKKGKKILTANYCKKHKIKRVEVHDEDYGWDYSW